MARIAAAFSRLCPTARHRTSARTGDGAIDLMDAGGKVGVASNLRAKR